MRDACDRGRALSEVEAFVLAGGLHTAAHWTLRASAHNRREAQVPVPHYSASMSCVVCPCLCFIGHSLPHDKHTNYLPQTLIATTTPHVSYWNLSYILTLPYTYLRCVITLARVLAQISIVRLRQAHARTRRALSTAFGSLPA